MSKQTYLCPISQNSATADTDMLHVKFWKNSLYLFFYAYTVDTDMVHSMSHVRKKITIYHQFSLHNAHGNRPIHTKYKEKACMYLNLIHFYVSAYIFMFYIPKQRHGRHGHGYLYAPCQIFEKFSICVLFCLHGGHRHGSFYVSCQEKITIYNQFSLHNEHGTYGFLHKQYKEKTCEYLYLIPIYLLAYIFMS